jgi:DMSO/TMAO reductase YedYZ molybdopterin-dependent catalytic subunit
MNRLVKNGCGVMLLALLLTVAAVFSPTQVRAATIDMMFDGTATLSPGGTFDVTAYNPGGGAYTVSETTPLGALQAAAAAKGFSYDVTDKNIGASGALLLDNIGKYTYVKGGSKWYAYVNEAFKDGYNNPAGALNLIELNNGDRVEFYYAAGIDDAANLDTVKSKATAAVKTTVSIGKSAPTDGASWTLQLSGAKTSSVSKTYFEEGLACRSSGHYVTWTDADGNVWGGVPLWLLVGMVDDNPDIGPDHFNFNDNLARQNYKVNVIAGDGWSATFDSTAIARNDGYVVANTLNGKPLPELTGSGKGSWPLHLKGSAVSGGQQVGNIVKIELADIQKAVPEIPELHIVKYAADQTTIVQEKTVDYKWMEKNLPVIGDGVTKYRYEGITNNPNDVWDRAEKYPGGFKIENAVKGTRVRDLCDLVGGMGSGTEIVFIAKDGYETRLPYSSIYPDPAVQARQGDATLAWWAEGKYVPDYADGMRLFFTPGGDHVYGQWDMHETLPEKYWHYYYADNVQYPSCAGLSAKYVTGIKIYTVPVNDWTLHLDGQDIGGLKEDINKTYFEQALACQFGANHKASYTDGKGRVWEGMPLWFLAGFVDDADKHSSESFNEKLAAAGYQVVITAADKHSVTIDSKDIIRNNNYIIANTLNGAPIPESDSNWPLRLVGPSVSGAASVSQIESIKLVKSPVLNDISGHWAQASIEKLVASGAVRGYPDGSFKPDAAITRAEFVTILTKAFKLAPQAGKIFNDTANHWAKDSVSTAASLGIVDGYNTDAFGPDDHITREQMAAMVVRAMNLELSTGETAFADNGGISPWAKDIIVTAVNKGILLGYPDNTFRPQGSATRAEAVTVIVKALEK